MTALALRDFEGLEVSDVELLAAGPSYTATTLAIFHAQGYAPTQLFFVTGADAFAEIATWRHYPTLLEAAHFVVVSRPGYDHEEVCRRAPDLRPRVADLRKVASPSTSIPESTSVIFVDAPTPDASSTRVRQRLAAGQTIDDLVPIDVLRHIERHHLYRPPVGGNPLA